jgi:hypothetical protein|tara:strand:- start:2794 stop:2907 length:114 start_codon:yes stop_codon:yes gene_type:complete
MELMAGSIKQKPPFSSLTEKVYKHLSARKTDGIMLIK